MFSTKWEKKVNIIPCKNEMLILSEFCIHGSHVLYVVSIKGRDSQRMSNGYLYSSIKSSFFILNVNGRWIEYATKNCTASFSPKWKILQKRYETWIIERNLLKKMVLKLMNKL